MSDVTASGSSTQVKCSYCRKEIDPLELSALRVCTMCGEQMPGIFFDKEGGLLALKLSNCIRGMGPLASSADGRFWTWQGGTWTPEPPDQTIVEKRAVRFLGDRFRGAHARAAEGIIRAKAARISCEPIEEYINFKNGLLNWRTGELEPHRADFMSTVQMGTTWDADAQCPGFQDFLAQVVPPDCKQLMWELVGYLMHSGNPLQTAAMLIGRGGNGKGTFLRMVKGLIGEANICAITLRQLADSSNRFAPAELFGRLCNIAGDIDASYVKDTAQLKSITGGDPIQAERKYRAPFVFTPWAVPVFSANEVPSSSDATEGYFRRWLVVEFPHTFTGREDRDLDARLAGELPGIAARAVIALRALLERGRWELPESALEAKDKFKQSVDQARRWLAAECTAEDGGFLPRPQAWTQYAIWAEEEHIKPLGRTKFFERIESSGYPLTRQDRVYGFSGVRYDYGKESPRTGHGFGIHSGGTVVTMPTRGPNG